MNTLNMGLLVSLLFPPSFIIALYYFDFEYVALVYWVFMFIYLIVAWRLKQGLKSISTPLIYFSFIVIAYVFNRIEFIKMIPALISATFFIIFFIAYIQKKALILSFTKKIYTGELSLQRKEFLVSSDLYWASVILLNTLIQIGLIFYASDEFWAFYSSLGWYIYLLIALTIQVAYERVFIYPTCDIR